MKAFKDYDSTPIYQDGKTLPAGGYVIKILESKEVETNNGSYIYIAFDIAEGQYKDYYMEQYKASTEENKKWKGVTTMFVPKDDGTEMDNNNKKRIKTFAHYIAQANAGYKFDWDETKWKEKIVGALFRREEFVSNGTKKMSTKFFVPVSVEKIRTNDFTVPTDKLLSETNNTGIGSSNGNMNVPAGLDEELPFN